MAQAASFLTEMTRKMLEKVERAGLPPLHQQPVAQARLSYRMGVGAMEGERI